MPAGSSRIYEADIVYQDGTPKLANQRLVLDSRDLPFRCTLEAQNFRPPDERELTFSAYGHNGTDACGVDLETKKVTNYSRRARPVRRAGGDLPRRPLDLRRDATATARPGGGRGMSTSGSWRWTAAARWSG